MTVIAGVENAVILSQQFLARVFADGAELVIDVGMAIPALIKRDAVRLLTSPMTPPARFS
jgi:hypothetical protein